jgi:hypothetical protein
LLSASFGVSRTVRTQSKSSCFLGRGRLAGEVPEHTIVCPTQILAAPMPVLARKAKAPSLTPRRPKPGSSLTLLTATVGLVPSGPAGCASDGDYLAEISAATTQQTLGPANFLSWTVCCSMRGPDAPLTSSRQQAPRRTRSRPERSRVRLWGRETGRRARR